MSAPSTRPAIVIDCGAFRCRAGWSSQDDPHVSFPQLVGRNKNKKLGDYVLVGHEIESASKNSLNIRTPFEKDVVCQFETMEYVLDHAFSSLSIDSPQIEHPILMTETFANPNASRRHMSELLFECYQVPSVCYGVDDLFSLYYNVSSGYLPSGSFSADRFSSSSSASFRSDCSLVVSSGYHSSFVVPVLNGLRDLPNSSRISLGGFHVAQFLHRHLLMRYPYHSHLLTHARIQEIMRKQTYCSLDFEEDLHLLSSKPDYNLEIVQLPFTKVEKPAMKTPEQIAALKEKRRLNAKRLQELAVRRRQAKLEEQKTLISSYRDLLERREEGEISEMDFLNEIRAGGFEGEEDFVAQYHSLERRVVAAMERGRDKKPKDDRELYPLLFVPDDELSPDQRKAKRIQKMQQANAEARQRKREAKELERLSKEQEILLHEQKFNENPQLFVAGLRRRKLQLLEQQDRRVKTREHSRRRKSSAARKRMRLIAELGSGQMDDNFGEDDSHWNVYRQLQPSDEDDEDDKSRTELNEVEELLRKFDPESSQGKSHERDLTEKDYQLRLTVDRIRAPEIMFQPSLIGLDQGGFGDTMLRVLNRYDSAVQLKLAKNVFVAGGNTLFKNFVTRLQNELRAIRPFDSETAVYHANDPLCDAWRGARLFANTPTFPEVSVTRAQYEERGGAYFIEHQFSNVYHQAPPVVDPLESEAVWQDDELSSRSKKRGRASKSSIQYASSPSRSPSR